MSSFLVMAMVCFFQMGLIHYDNVEGVTADKDVIKARYLIDLAKFAHFYPKDPEKSQEIKQYHACFAGGESVAAKLESEKYQHAIPWQVKVVHVSMPDQVQDCNMVYIGQNQTKDQVLMILSKVKSRHALTVGSVTDFTQMGGMVEFTDNDTQLVRMKVHILNAARADIYFDKLILEVAQSVVDNKL